MAGTFPNLASGQTAMYPAQRAIALKCRTHRFVDDSEQRYAVAVPLNSWVLEYNSLKIADVNTLRAFFETQKGEFDKTWVFPFDGASFTAMTFEQDDFGYTEEATRPGYFNLQLRCRQVAKSGTYASGLAATFPTINGGVRTQLPFTTTLRFKSIKIDMDSGQKYAFAARAAALRSWSLNYSVITPAELATLQDFFCSMGGPLSPFTFRDPETAVDYTARFGSDVFNFRYVSKNHRSTSLQIEQLAA